MKNNATVSTSNRRFQFDKSNLTERKPAKLRDLVPKVDSTASLVKRLICRHKPAQPEGGTLSVYLGNSPVPIDLETVSKDTAHKSL